ncbi:MAG: ABC transporter permease [Planctomycetes bacterium SM23_32]|nr:MAG: ABC transporter permease [Planctomycetes bacterium SM23_32]
MPRERIRFAQVRRHWSLYALMVPTLVLVAMFMYLPAISGVYHSFYRWDGDELATYVGMRNYRQAFGDPELGWAFVRVGILFGASLFKMVPSIVTAVVIHRITRDRLRYFYRLLFVVPMVIPWMVGLLIWKFFYNPVVGLLNRFLSTTGILDILAAMNTWAVKANVVESVIFQVGRNPAWLGDSDLALAAYIFWGFPWIGVIGVLIYLSGLEKIPHSVYECADLDGVGWFGKFLYIELPLIATQVRINLVLLIIGVLKGYGLVLVLLGETGGPGGAVMVPGLYMYYNAFVKREAGYACAIGILVFFVILALTYVNNKLVRVER